MNNKLPIKNDTITPTLQLENFRSLKTCNIYDSKFSKFQIISEVLMAIANEVYE